MTNRRFTLARRPVGDPVEEDFRLVEEAVPTAQNGNIVVRNHYLSLDPTQRLWIGDEVETGLPRVELGEPVRASTIGVVHASDSPDFKPGDWVLGLSGMEDYSVVQPGGFTMKVDVSVVPSPTNFLSILGAVGLTAYFGLLVDGKPKPGENLLISGAAGAVGSAVGQIGKMKGCYVVGIAGGAEKCRRLIDDYGFDAAIDYRGKNTEELAAEIAKVLPNGADIVFENIGGTVFDAELLNLAEHARIVLSGMIVEYNAKEPIGVRHIQQVLLKDATLKAFRIANHVAQFGEAGQEMAKWVSEGSLRADEDIQEGLENAFPAFMRLFSGANTGKLILKIA